MLFTASSLIFQRKIDKLTDTLVSIKRDSASYNKVIKEIEAIKKKRKDIKIRTDIIKDLSVDRLTVLNLLNFISENIIPQKMWLKSIRIDKNRVNIQGFAIDNKTAVDFMKRLENAGYFLPINIKNLKRDKVYAGLNFKTFEVFCFIKKNEKKENS